MQRPLVEVVVAGGWDAVVVVVCFVVVVVVDGDLVVVLVILVAGLLVVTVLPPAEHALTGNTNQMEASSLFVQRTCAPFPTRIMFRLGRGEPLCLQNPLISVPKQPNVSNTDLPNIAKKRRCCYLAKLFTYF